MKGYHYTGDQCDLKVGDIITSQQHTMRTFKMVWDVYKSVEPKLPEQFGYAYPTERSGFTKGYIVESDEYLACNLNYSVYYTMDALTSQKFQFDKTIPLKDRLKLRNEWLLKQAQNYFKTPSDLTKVELISSSFKVVSKI